MEIERNSPARDPLDAALNEFVAERQLEREARELECSVEKGKALNVGST
jgi:hypothetical protein